MARTRCRDTGTDPPLRRASRPSTTWASPCAGGLLTGFVGGNGAGKTTTMRMVMGVLGIARGRGALGRPADHRGRPPPLRLHARGARPLPEAEGRSTSSSTSPSSGAWPAAAARAAVGGAPRAVRARRPRRRPASRSSRSATSSASRSSPRSCTTPIALVLDEPFSGLDPAAVDSMADLLREHAGTGVPVLFSQPPARPRRAALRPPRRPRRAAGSSPPGIGRRAPRRGGPVRYRLVARRRRRLGPRRARRPRGRRRRAHRARRGRRGRRRAGRPRARPPPAAPCTSSRPSDPPWPRSTER